MTTIQNLQKNEIRAISVSWFIFFVKLQWLSLVIWRKINRSIWILVQFNSNWKRVDHFFSWSRNGLIQDKFVILFLEFMSERSKSQKLRKIQIMENQDSCTTLIENQSKDGPDAGKDEQVLVHTRSIGAKNEDAVVEENNLTYAELWALRQRIFQENVRIWIISSKIDMNMLNKLGQYTL